MKITLETEQARLAAALSAASAAIIDRRYDVATYHVAETDVLRRQEICERAGLTATLGAPSDDAPATFERLLAAAATSHPEDVLALAAALADATNALEHAPPTMGAIGVLGSADRIRQRLGLPVFRVLRGLPNVVSAG